MSYRVPASGSGSAAYSGANVNTAEGTTTPADFTNLATVGPSVTVTTGTSALVTFCCMVYSSNLGALCGLGVAVSGATTLNPTTATAAQDLAVFINAPVANYYVCMSRTIYLTGLTAGSNTFKLVYWTNAGTATFLNRCITVLA